MNAAFLVIRKVVKTSQFSLMNHIHILGIRLALACNGRPGREYH